MMFIDGKTVVVQDRNTSNTIPVSEQNNRTLNNQTLNRTKENRIKQESNNKLARNKIDTELLSFITKACIMTIQNLQSCNLFDYGTDKCTLFCLNVNSKKSNVLTRVSLPSHRAHKQPFEKSIEALISLDASYLTYQCSTSLVS